MDVLLISPRRLLRDALVAVLQGADGRQARGASCRGTVDAALAGFAPGVVVVDAAHPEGAALAAAVRAQAPGARVVVLAAGGQDEEFLAWADAGLSGYLEPDASAEDLLCAVRRVGAGEVACPPRLTALLLNRFAGRSLGRAERAGLCSLTVREREVAELLADGLSNKLIARRLSVALPTVKNHVHSILEKWDCRSRGEAAARCRRQGRDGARPGSGTVVELRAGGVPARAPASFGRKAA